MKIKSLELQGYKTFATRTVFEFTGEIAAIVGPNGSGKSNITDSLRWVLGEQSFSLLRAKRTEDLIFSGSEYRPQAGMASATVVLDNQDNWLPVDFSDVAITRRAYRDGQNEYLLNGQRVRLRDIVELLARSGLAERTYTIVGQGLVDLALSLNADERRRLFEDAAGIGIHRYRKEEALRRLDATQRNIDRVKDVLAEIEPRLLSLERQSRRAREYALIKADLMALLKEWYSYHWHQSQKEIARAKQAMDAQEKILEARRKNVEDSENSLKASRISFQQIRAEFTAKQKEFFDVKSKHENIKNKRAILEERKSALNREELVIKERIKELEDEINQNQSRVKDIAQEIQRLEIERSEVSEQLIHYEQQLQALQDENSKVIDAYQKAQQELATLVERRSNLEQSIHRMTSERERFSEEMTVIEKAIEAKTGEIDEARESFRSQQRLLGEISSEREKLGREIEENQKKMAFLEMAKASLREEIVATQSKIDQLNTQRAALNRSSSNGSDLIDGYRVIGDGWKSERYHIYGLLRDHIHIPTWLETAIFAAMGEYVEGVLLGKDGLENLIQDLKSKPVNLTLLSAESVQKDDPIKIDQRMKGVIGVASRLIKSTGEIQPILDILLGKTLIVQDHTMVRKVFDALPVTCVVTLDGEVFIRNGAVIIRRGIAREHLDVQKHIRDLAEEIEKSEQSLAQLLEKFHELEEQLVTSQGEKCVLEEKVASLEEQEDRLLQAQNAIQRKIEDVERQIKMLEDKRDWLNRQLQMLTLQIADLNSKKDAIEGDIKSNENELTNSRETLSRLFLDEYRRTLSDFEKRFELIGQKIEDLGSRQADVMEASRRAASELEGRVHRLNEMEKIRTEIDKDLDGLMNEEKEISRALEVISSMMSSLERQMVECEKDYDDLQRKEREVRQALSIAEHQYAQTKINLSRAQESLELLRRRIEDDFGLVELAYNENISGPTPLPLDGFVEQLPTVTELSPDIEETIKRQKALLRHLGAINPEAESEYQQVKERYDFLVAQLEDLNQAEGDIRQVIAELDALIEQEFKKTFEAVSKEFRNYFARLFGGGSARLLLTDAEQISTSGVDIEVRLPGRREHGLSLLSGGERSLVAISLIFALIKISPTPFCVLDEVDAMLDEANTARFRDLLRELSQKTQFIVITHNRNTVEAADVIYGITMGRDSTSQVVSLRLDEVDQVV